MPRARYDIDASWDDPFERRNERRAVDRTAVRFKIKIAVDLANKDRPLVGPGVVNDISPRGLCCRTKHRLSPGQSVRVMISMNDVPPHLGLPKRFIGGAQVVRTSSTREGVSIVSLRFDDALRDDISLAVFIEHLQNAPGAASA